MTAPQTTATTDPQGIIAALQQRLDAALSEKAALTEALAQRNSEYGERIQQQSATIDVLKVMSASPGDAQPVFDQIVRRATALCNGIATGLFEYDGELVYHRAHVLPDDLVDRTAFQAYSASFPMAPMRGSLACRAILDRQIIHIRDIAADPELSPLIRTMLNGLGSQISIPLLRDGQAIGAITLTIRERGGFSDSQVELLKTFAEQAVIAITSAETYRALQTRTGDLQEALEYQTATSEVLKVISRSGAELEAALDTLVQTAARLCDAQMAFIHRREGGVYRPAAVLGFPLEFTTYLKTHPLVPGRGSIAGRVAMEGRAIHIVDVAADPEYALSQSIVMANQRTALGVPLLRENELIGVIVLARQRVQPFTDRQIELVSTFADQAVIAMENARLLTEQQEALEQQTATAEVLQVINANPGNLTPVFDAILDKAHTLCGAAIGSLVLFDGTYFRAVATHGWPNSIAALFSEPAGPNRARQRLVDGERFVQVADICAIGRGPNSAWGDAVVESTDARTMLLVPLRKDGALLGFISAFRPEVRVFSDKEIALLENFAAQAVIAMENARLLTETREALEQQTATAEVLQIINTSSGDLSPVLDTIGKNAIRLCEAAFGGLMLYNGERFEAVALGGVPPAYAEFCRLNPAYGQVRPHTVSGRLLAGASVVQNEDTMASDAYRNGDPAARALVDLGGARTLLGAALRKDGTFFGAITIYRKDVRRFNDRQVALLQNFADQAAIAIENARLITDQRDALDQQTAIARV